MATILDGAVKAFAWMERREIRRYFYFSYFSHCIWKDHDCSLVMYKNGTFYKQQVGGAPAAGFAGFSIKFSKSGTYKYISAHCVKIALHVP